MNIYKKGDKLIMEVDLFQNRCNPYDEKEEQELTDNLIGVIKGDEFTINYLNDLSYKDSQQTGMPILHFYGDKKEFEKICSDLGLMVEKYDPCAYCNKTIWGSYTLGDKGKMCFSCDADGLK